MWPSKTLSIHSSSLLFFFFLLLPSGTIPCVVWLRSSFIASQRGRWCDTLTVETWWGLPEAHGLFFPEFYIIHTAVALSQWSSCCCEVLSSHFTPNSNMPSRGRSQRWSLNVMPTHPSTSWNEYRLLSVVSFTLFCRMSLKCDFLFKSNPPSQNLWSVHSTSVIWYNLIKVPVYRFLQPTTS